MPQASDDAPGIIPGGKNEFLTILHPKSSHVNTIDQPELVNILSDSMSGAVVEKSTHPYLILFSSKADGGMVSTASYQYDFSSSLASTI